MLNIPFPPRDHVSKDMYCPDHKDLMFYTLQASKPFSLIETLTQRQAIDSSSFTMCFNPKIPGTTTSYDEDNYLFINIPTLHLLGSLCFENEKNEVRIIYYHPIAFEVGIIVFTEDGKWVYTTMRESRCLLNAAGNLEDGSLKDEWFECVSNQTNEGVLLIRSLRGSTVGNAPFVQFAFKPEMVTRKNAKYSIAVKPIFRDFSSMKDYKTSIIPKNTFISVPVFVSDECFKDPRILEQLKIENICSSIEEIKRRHQLSYAQINALDACITRFRGNNNLDEVFYDDDEIGKSIDRLFMEASQEYASSTKKP